MNNVAYFPGQEPEQVPDETPRGPQLEDGFTRISNELLVAMGRARLKATEYPVVLFVARETFGWGVKHKVLRVDYMARELDMGPTKVSEAVAGLLRRKVLYRVGDSQGPLGINKHYAQWERKAGASKTVKRPDSKTGKVHEKREGTIHEKGERSTHEKRESNKERKDRKDITPLSDQSDRGELESLFNEFWQAGLRKDGKKPAKEKFIALLKKQEDPSAFTERLIADIQTRLDAAVPGFEKLHPKTYLNQERWQDDLPERCPHAAILAAWNDELPAHIEKLSPEDWTPDNRGFQALASAWENFKTKPRSSTGKPVFADEQEGIEFYREVFRRLAKVDRVRLEDSARWCRLSWAVQQAETIRIFKGELA